MPLKGERGLIISGLCSNVYFGRTDMPEFFSSQELPVDRTNIWLSECLPFDEDGIFPYDIIRGNILFECTSFQQKERKLFQLFGDLFKGNNHIFKKS